MSFVLSHTLRLTKVAGSSVGAELRLHRLLVSVVHESECPDSSCGCFIPSGKSPRDQFDRRVDEPRNRSRLRIIPWPESNPSRTAHHIDGFCTQTQAVTITVGLLKRQAMAVKHLVVNFATPVHNFGLHLPSFRVARQMALHHDVCLPYQIIRGFPQYFLLLLHLVVVFFHYLYFHELG